MLDDIVAHDIAQGIRFPSPTTQNRLLAPGARIAGRLGSHPSRLALFRTQKPINKLPSRRRDAILCEQRAYPFFDIAQRRCPKFKRRLDRRPKRHPAANEGSGGRRVMDHQWTQRFNLTCCAACGIVKRADDQNNPCKGAVPVGPRAQDARRPERLSVSPRNDVQRWDTPTKLYESCMEIGGRR